MPSKKDLFLKHVGQTSTFPMIIEVEKAEGMYIHDVFGKKYLDMDSGFSVSSLGHRHPVVIEAIKNQIDKYLHTTVYGEHIQIPQVEYGKTLSDILGEKLSTIYFANGGAEAVEIALKASRKYTDRYEIIAAKNAYHGSTFGAESLRSDLEYTQAFLPTIPGVRHIHFNNFDDLQKITTKTACVVIEVIQAEAGVIIPIEGYISAIRKRCDETNTILIFDEIQTGFGRTGKLFAFLHYNVEPDILLIAKAMGGGMPIAGMVTRQEIMSSLSMNPALGHINTFGGHPVNVAAALATLLFLNKTNIIDEVEKKSSYLLEKINHKAIKEIRYKGLFMGVQLHDKNILPSLVESLRNEGVLVDFFLFNDDSFRLAPPLILEKEHMDEFVEKLHNILDLL